ncbi:phage tail protein [Lentisphaerota bacterium WC36G]|nr:phage tail protein [Lentisphaerae bacterium WC36]
MKRPQINLKFWQCKEDLSKIAKLFDGWWNKMQEYLMWLPNATDVETAPLTIVKLIAWGRDIDRLKNEPEEMFRLRVKHALANALDAGSVAGFENIWNRLKLGSVAQNERIDVENWDVIQLVLSNSDISNNNELMNEIIRKYGRTCRRYEFVTEQNIDLGIRTFNYNYLAINSIAKQPNTGENE